jgi:hypothetical protein
LLSIHGFERRDSSQLITPARYQLNFFECSLCSHHAARLTTDEIVDDKWVRQAQFGEVYWGSVTERPSVLSILVAAPKAYLRIFPEFLDSLDITLSIPKLITGGAAVLMIGLISISATLTYRERKGVAAVNAAAQKNFKKRFKTQVPAPGSEAAVRRTIDEYRFGKPNYALMTPLVANTIRQSLPEIQAMIADFGALESVRFEGVSQDHADIYQIQFENGSLEYMIWLAPDGKTITLFALIRP